MWHYHRLIERIIVPSRFTSGKRRRTTTRSINQELHVWVVTCPHRLGNIGIGNDRQHHPRPVGFRQAMSTNIMQNWLDNINRGKPTSVVTWANPSVDDGRVLPASAVSDEYLCHFRASTAHITLRLHTMVSWCRYFPTRIAFGMHPMVRWRRVWRSRIAFGLHKMVIHHQTWSARIVFVLQTIVSRRQMCTTCMVYSLHLSVYQHQTWPDNIIRSLHTYLCRRPA